MTGAASNNSFAGLPGTATTGYMQVLQPNTCPQCGYCPHCKRSNPVPVLNYPNGGSVTFSTTTVPHK